MHPQEHLEDPWPQWVSYAVQRLSGYTLYLNGGLDTPTSVDREHRLINVMPYLSREHVLLSIIAALVYIRTGDRITPEHNNKLADVIPLLPRIRPRGGDGSYLPD